MKMIKFILIGFLSPQLIFSTIVVFLSNVYFGPLLACKVSMDLERLCTQDFNNFTSSLHYTRSYRWTCSGDSSPIGPGSPFPSSLSQIISGCCVPSPQYSEFGELPEPYCVCAQGRSRERIGATMRQHAEPLPVRLVNTTLEMTIFLLE